MPEYVCSAMRYDDFMKTVGDISSDESDNVRVHCSFIFKQLADPSLNYETVLYVRSDAFNQTTRLGWMPSVQSA